MAYQGYFVKKLILSVLFAEELPNMNKFLSNRWYLDDMNEKLSPRQKNIFMLFKNSRNVKVPMQTFEIIISNYVLITIY